MAFLRSPSLTSLLIFNLYLVNSNLLLEITYLYKFYTGFDTITLVPFTISTTTANLPTNGPNFINTTLPFSNRISAIEFIKI